MLPGTTIMVIKALVPKDRKSHGKLSHSDRGKSCVGEQKHLLSALVLSVHFLQFISLYFLTTGTQLSKIQFAFVNPTRQSMAEAVRLSLSAQWQLSVATSLPVQLTCFLCYLRLTQD
jgi:hypothetical protein